MRRKERKSRGKLRFWIRSVLRFYWRWMRRRDWPKQHLHPVRNQWLDKKFDSWFFFSLGTKITPPPWLQLETVNTKSRSAMMPSAPFVWISNSSKSKVSLAVIRPMNPPMYASIASPSLYRLLLAWPFPPFVVPMPDNTVSHVSFHNWEFQSKLYLRWKFKKMP